MQTASEYMFYDGTLTIGVHTPRLEPTPATVFLAGTLHSEYLAKVRSALREYRVELNLASGLHAFLPTEGGFPLYGIRAIRPGGALRSVDDDFNMEVTLQRFGVMLAMLPTTFQADPEKAFAVERVMEKAAKDCLAAAGLPYLTIPGDQVQLADTYIDVSFELGAASELDAVQVNA